MKSLIIVAALLVSTAALADDRQNSMLFEQHKLQAQQCLRNSLPQVRGNDQMIVYMWQTCTQSLSMFMKTTLKEPKKRVDAYVLALGIAEARRMDGE